MIYYLAHPYEGQEESSFAKAQKWTFQLQQQGHTVFSPIMHSHPFYTGLATYGVLRPVDFIQWDLALLEGWCVNKDYVAPYGICEVGSELLIYQPKITILMSRTAYDGKCYERNWHSKGCRREYEFAKEHHIRVLLLEDFVEGKEVEL